MSKNKNVLVVSTIILIIIGVHFVPIQKRDGNLDPNQVATNCMAYSKPVSYKYRLIVNENNKFQEERKKLLPNHDYSIQELPCPNPVSVQLYLW